MFLCVSGVVCVLCVSGVFSVSVFLAFCVFLCVSGVLCVSLCF